MCLYLGRGLGMGTCMAELATVRTDLYYGKQQMRKNK